MILNFVGDYHIDAKEDDSRRVSFYKAYYNAPDWNMEYERYLERLNYRHQRKLHELAHSPRFWENNSYVTSQTQERAAEPNYQTRVQTPSSKVTDNYSDRTNINPTTMVPQTRNVSTQHREQNEQLVPRMTKLQLSDNESREASDADTENIQERRSPALDDDATGNRVLSKLDSKGNQRPRKDMSKLHSQKIFSERDRADVRSRILKPCQVDNVQSNRSTQGTKIPSESKMRLKSKPGVRTSNINSKPHVMTSPKQKPPFSLYGCGEPSNNHMTYNVLSQDQVYDSARRAKLSREAAKVRPKTSPSRTEKMSPRQLNLAQFSRHNDEENWVSEYQHCYSSRNSQRSPIA